MLITTDKNNKVGVYRKTYTGLGSVNGYYYYFKLKSGSRLRLTAPDDRKWSLYQNLDIYNNNFSYDISQDEKLLTIYVKNLDKNTLYLYDFCLDLNGVSTFISFIVNWNYQSSYNHVYYNNQIVGDPTFMLGYSDCLYYCIQYQNVFPTFTLNESQTEFNLNLQTLINDIDSTWTSNSSILLKPHQSKIQEILDRLNYNPGILYPQIQILWTVTPPTNIILYPEVQVLWNIETPMINQSIEPQSEEINLTAEWVVT